MSNNCWKPLSLNYIFVKTGLSTQDKDQNIEKEKPCFQCQRKNDIGVKTCWWCGSQNPTKSLK